MIEKTYPLAPDAVFRTYQGEGHLAGLPMIFVRLGGCSVGCEKCDTNYKVSRRAAASQIREEAARLLWGGVGWAWVTGGEPLDHDLTELIRQLRTLDLNIALATSGTHEARRGHTRMGGVDFLSVSPHGPKGWIQRSGDQLNLVPGLNGLSLSDPEMVEAVDGCWREFSHRTVTPMMDRRGRIDGPSLEACKRWVDGRAGWRLGSQAHRQWGVA
jgi:organic radical activating enzyme